MKTARTWLLRNLSVIAGFSSLFLGVQVHGNPLRWDSMDKLVEVTGGLTNKTVSFWVTNTSTAHIRITTIRTSCGCTEVESPDLPWKLSPGSTGKVSFSTDIRGKYGRLFKSTTIESSAGTQMLKFQLHINALEAMLRNRNQQLAKADPQAIFHGKCAACHSEPAQGKRGGALYLTACGICHEAEHRASMVPNLHLIALPKKEVDWMTLLSTGKPDTLMPGFAKRHGGPLTDDQLKSLIQYIMVAFPNAR